MKKSIITAGGTLALALCLTAASASADAWKFGVLSDTQWTSADDGKSPESVPASMIQQIDQAFIAQGVKVVIAVGDTVDTSTPMTQNTRALYSQDLYNAGIAFYPLRGNHDAELTNSGTNFATLYPQIVNGGSNNQTPTWDTPFYIETNLSSTDTGLQSLAKLTADFNTGVPPATPAGSPFVVGGNFSYPTQNCPIAGVPGYPGITAGNGLTYSFDLNNVRFVLLDQFVDSDLGGNTSSLASQQPWITQRVSDTARPAHAFIFSHKQLLGGNHKDNLFGANITSADPGDGYGVSGLTGANLAAMTAKQNAEDSFITALNTHNVHYLITGHDHHHVDSLVKDPLNPAMTVHEIITQSDSSKFYTPGTPFSANEVSISEDLYQVGYYIFTVDGPRVTVDYYAVPANTTSTFATTPVLTGNWQKALTLGYSLNGQEFMVAQGSSYTAITDSTAKAIANAAVYGENPAAYVGTTLQILNGSNGSVLKTHDGRKLTKAVDTGWAPANGTVSDIVTLWGLTDLGAVQTDTLVVSLSFNLGALNPSDLSNGLYCLGSRDLKSGVWINAVDGNIVGGKKQFVYGAYNATYGLGTYGIDPVAQTAWAVVNGANRDFAVISTPTA
ncbi:MAG: metallophosphoesterase, partial [Opitutaceae bacterium]